MQIPSGTEAHVDFIELMYRLKPVPFTGTSIFRGLRREARGLLTGPEWETEPALSTKCVHALDLSLLPV